MEVVVNCCRQHNCVGNFHLGLCLTYTKFLEMTECTAGYNRIGHGMLCLTAAENKDFQISSLYAFSAILNEIPFNL